MSQDGTTPNPNELFNAGAAKVLNNQGMTFGGERSSLRFREIRDRLEVKRYPSNIGSDEVPHYAMFFITKRSGDIGTGEAFGKAISADSSNANRPVLNGIGKGALQGISTLGTATVGSNVAKTIGNTVAGTGSMLSGLIQTGGALAGGAAGYKASQTITNTNDTTSRSQSDVVTNARDRVVLKKCIALYIPGTPSSTYKAIWQDRDIGILGGAEQFLSNIDNSDSILNTTKSILSGLAPAAVAIGIANAPKFEGLGDLGGLVTSSQGIAINPFRTQLFQNMGFRTFSFDYSFQPKSHDEYIEVKEIIKTFKKYMHPTLKKDRIIMGYPGEFTIVYYYKDGVNDNLFKVGNCVLTDMKVTYGGTDFITFKDSEGQPSEMNMSLQFTELEILTEDRVEEGY